MRVTGGGRGRGRLVRSRWEKLGGQTRMLLSSPGADRWAQLPIGRDQHAENDRN